MSGFSNISLKRDYNRWNKKYWNYELPDETDIIFSPVPDDRDADCNKQNDGSFLIRISPIYQASRPATRWFLSHEMCHIPTWHGKAFHGDLFYAEWLRVLNAGLLRELY